MTQIFISYSRKDIVFIEQLVADLKFAGIDAWYDLSGLEGGARWSKEIEKAIRASEYVIVVLSPDSVASIWVEEEILYARNLKRKIIPLLYKPCEIPLGFHTINFIDVRDGKYWQNYKEILRALGINVIKREEAIENVRLKAEEEIQRVANKKSDNYLKKDRSNSIIKPLLISLFLIICVASTVFLGIPIIRETFNGIESQATQSSAFSTESIIQATQFASDIQVSLAKTSAAELTLTTAAFTATPLSFNEKTILTPVMTSTSTSNLTPVVASTLKCNLAEFITDLNIPDGTVMTPGKAFVKKWRVRNSGACVWSGFMLVFDSGDIMGGPPFVTFSTVNPGQEIDLEVNLIAPALQGTYRGYWRIETSANEMVPIVNGDSGKRFFLEIKVN